MSKKKYFQQGYWDYYGEDYLSYYNGLIVFRFSKWK